MAILTVIDGVPLYTTSREALDWADSRGLTGYHTHVFDGQTGYMGGTSHQQAFLGSTNIIAPGSVVDSIGTVTSVSTIGPPAGGGAMGGGGGGY